MTLMERLEAKRNAERKPEPVDKRPEWMKRLQPKDYTGQAA